MTKVKTYRINITDEIKKGEFLTIGDVGELETKSLGTAAEKNVGTSEGEVPILGAEGRLDDNILPNRAMTKDMYDPTQVEGDAFDYRNLHDKPEIPNVYDPTITFRQGGVTKGSISLNQQGETVIELDAGGVTAGDGIRIDEAKISVNHDDTLKISDGKLSVAKVTGKLSELENDVGFITAEYHDATKQNIIEDLEDIRDKANTALQEESDPTVPAHVKNITQNNIATWNNKQNAISDLADIRSGAALGKTAIQTELDPTVPSYVKAITENDISSWNSKQEAISDLESIRNGAILGKTAVQEELDPTVPAHVKAITENNISSWNAKQNTITDLEDIREGAGLGKTALQQESDPIFISSPAYSITQQNITDWNNKQGTISDIETIRTGASKGMTSVQPGDLATVATTGSFNDLTNKPVIDTILNVNSDNAVANKVIAEKINQIELSKAPNVSIIGTPNIVQGNISGFSTSNYLIAPFLSSFAGYPFTFHMDFTTSDDVTTQQNILDSVFGLAFAIKDGKFIIALSSNGTSWNLGQHTGTHTITPNTYYCVELEWTGSKFIVRYSLNKTDFTVDINANCGEALSGHTLFIGGHGTVDHPFLGVFNFNEWSFYSGEQIVWQGMDDAGLATRANLSLSNLNALGEARFTAKQDVITDLESIRQGAELGTTALQSETDPIYTADKPNIALKSELEEKLDKTQYVGGQDLTRGLTFKTRITGFADLSNNQIGDNSQYQPSTLNNGTAHRSSGATSGMIVFIKFDKPTKVSAISLNFSSTGTYGKPTFVISGGNNTDGLTPLISRQTPGDGLYQYPFDEVEYQYYQVTITNGNWIDLRFVYVQNTQDGILSFTDYNEFKNKQNAISDLATIRSGASLGATALQSESDPTVPAYVKAITQENINTWNSKQDAISDLDTIRSKANSAVQPTTLNSFATLVDLSNGLKEKQDKLPNGTTGQVLKKTTDGVEWGDVVTRAGEVKTQEEYEALTPVNGVIYFIKK